MVLLQIRIFSYFYFTTRAYMCLHNVHVNISLDKYLVLDKEEERGGLDEARCHRQRVESISSRTNADTPIVIRCLTCQSPSSDLRQNQSKALRSHIQSRGYKGRHLPRGGRCRGGRRGGSLPPSLLHQSTATAV